MSQYHPAGSLKGWLKGHLDADHLTLVAIPAVYGILGLTVVAWQGTSWTKLNDGGWPAVLDWAADQQRVGMVMIGGITAVIAVLHGLSIRKKWTGESPWHYSLVVLELIAAGYMFSSFVNMGLSRDRPVTYVAQGCNHTIVPVPPPVAERTPS